MKPGPSARRSFGEDEVRQRVRQKLESIDVTLRRPPERTPHPLIPDGALLGNGDLGVVLSGPPEALRFWLSKNDFWKARRLYPEGGPRLFGGLDIRLAGLRGASYEVTQRLYDATTHGTFRAAESQLSLEAWTPAGHQALIVRLGMSGAPQCVEVALWAKSGDGSVASSHTDGPDAMAVRRFDRPEYEWSTGMAAHMRVLGAEDSSFTLRDGQSVTIVVAVTTTEDGPAFEEVATERLKALQPSALDDTRQEHLRYWHEFWAKSFVDIGDPLIEKYYYGGYYLLACCSRNTSFPPGLYGNWITSDRPEWAGDYHLNYNYQAPWWGVYAGNRLELADPYDQPLLEYMPVGRRYATEYAGRPGLYYDVGIGPRSLDTCYESFGPSFHAQKSNATFGAANMLMRVYAERDERYAQRIYPYLLEAAEFWEADMLYEGGRYHLVDDCLNEVGPWNGPDWRERLDRNNVLSLGLVRMLFRGLLEVDAMLGVGNARRETWEHILAELSPYPIGPGEDGKRRLLGAEQGLGRFNYHEFNKRLFMQGLVFPTGNEGREQASEAFALLAEETEAMSDAPWLEAFNGFDTVFPAAARLGAEPTRLLDRLRRKLRRDGYDNLWIYQGGGGIETIGGITAGVQEMLLQSYEGVVRLFPCWPADRDARFERLRADGAFIMSAHFAGGRVRECSILSERGGQLVVVQPWPGAGAHVEVNGLVATSESDLPAPWRADRMVLMTQPGDRIRLTPFHAEQDTTA